MIHAHEGDIHFETPTYTDIHISHYQAFIPAAAWSEVNEIDMFSQLHGKTGRLWYKVKCLHIQQPEIGNIAPYHPNLPLACESKS